MKKPIIAVTPLVDKEKNSLWMLPEYFNALSSSGAIPFMLPLTTDKVTLKRLLDCSDGLLITGGQDVNPYFYGEEKQNLCGEICSKLDEQEKILLDIALKQNKSVLGICRGLQFLNAYFGGTLYQDLQAVTKIEHHMQPPYDRGVHSVTIVKNSLLDKIVGRRKLQVNSYHHQAVKNLSEKLTLCAVSEDGITEGAYLADKKFVLAVQWHPEYSYNLEESKKIFKAFVNSCKE